MNTPDVEVQNHGSLFLFHLLTDAAREWVAANVQDDAMYLGRALAVEHRYAYDLVHGMIGDGLTVA